MENLDNIDEKHKCIVCWEVLKVPVRPKPDIFTKCKCWENYRACVRCFRKYIEKNEDNPIDLNSKLKCPMCLLESDIYTKLKIKRLPGKEIYIKDKQIYNEIERLIGNGTYPKIKCKCGDIFSKTRNYELHIQNECPESWTRCERCNKNLQRKDLEHHLRTCDPIRCKRCNKNLQKKFRTSFENFLSSLS